MKRKLLVPFAFLIMIFLSGRDVSAQSCTPLGGSCSPGGQKCCGNSLCAINEAGYTFCQKCEDVLSPEECAKSAGGGGGEIKCKGQEAIDTAIGCIPIDSTQGLIGFFLKWAVGIAGGIAFIFIAYAGFLITTSGGDPKKAQAGRELLTAAISGIVFLIFSTFILRLVGVDILGISGLTK